MSYFISYAQNFEDVMLWRALKHIKNGFYIDVGAWSPDLDSVTRHFYESSWRGINVEPNPEFYAQYVSKRVNDINLKVAVSNISGIADIFFSTNPGLSSLDKDIAEGHKGVGWDVIPSKTEVTTIKNICEKFCQNQEIHFLKIDIEGYEKQALLGNDWSLYRPWIVVVEATLPMSQVENYLDWEYILLQASYDFVYADGLNRFYVSQEHSELKPAFQYPPNVFDGFVLANQVEAEQRANEAKEEAHKWWINANEANIKATLAEQRANEAKEEAHKWWINANEANIKATLAEQSANEAWQNYYLIEKSNSWKLTKPLRLAGKMVRWFLLGTYHWLTFSPTSRPRRVVKKLLIKIKNYINSRPKLKYKILNIINHFPKLKAKLKAVGQNDYSISNHLKSNMYNIESIHLSPRAKEIYLELKKAINEQNVGSKK